MLVTLVDSLKWMLDLIGEPRETSELMGVSTLAFRMKISERTTFADGIYVFDWKQTVKDFAEILGYQVSLLFGQLSGMPVPLLAAVERFPVVLPIEEAVLPFIRRYINLGKPVLYFDTMAAKPYVHEWSVIYGYDDERRVVHVTDQLRPEGKILSYDDVTHNPVRFLAGIDGKLEQAAGAKPLEDSERRKQAERTVRFAVNYARNGCDYRPKTDYLRYSSGLAAYDQWIGYMSNPHMVPNRYGMGHLTAYYSETKKQASLYLRNVPFEGEAMRLTLLASEAFEQAAEQLEEMSEVVPFVRASELMTAEIREKCKVYLNKAKEFESAAIGYLEKAITWMR